MKWVLSAGVALFLLTCAAPVQGQLGSWELGIDYPQDNEDVPFSVGINGVVSIQFFVNNEELADIGVEFDYEIPFEGESDGPESETIGAGDNKSFILTISGIDVWSYAADSREEFTISATLVSRAGLPIALPGEVQEAVGDLKIPTIYSLEVDISDPVGAMNAGSDVILTVTVTNRGNVQDKVGEVEVSDNCPLLTTDNGLDSLMTSNIGAGQSAEANLIATASESHPRRNCKIEVSVSSNGAMNSGGSEIADADTTVTVEPPLVADEENNDPDDTDNPVEIVSSSLPAPGITTLICVLAVASLAAPRRF
ncbi:MAG TPA: hypothetical protein EYQ15_02590 [Candidatus Poseidoniales archaeon]|nr:MAG: hypothetical protein CXT65_05545 [Euryarchaeota archaeon]HIG38185.1 hypothetical protein [Candidatus Poseidoniales archaeon]HIL43581.1 hypothetical protein [Candidatus Poseidoniales archaeon]